MESPQNRGLFNIGLLLIILIITGLFVWWNIQRTDRQMRQELMQQANLVASTLHFHDITSLSATTADLEKTEYNILKKQLSAAISSNSNYRFIYLMGRGNDGEVFFYLDNDEEEPAAPGEKYPEASRELREIFDHGEAFTEGPMPDQWGVWVSAITPIIDKTSGKVIAVLGIDSDASVWQKNVIVNSANTIIISLILVFGIAVAAYYIRRQSYNTEPALPTLIVPLSIVFLLTVSAGILLLHMQQEDELITAGKQAKNKITIDLHQRINQQFLTLKFIGEIMLSDSEMVRAVNRKDYSFLHSRYGEMFSRLSIEQHISHIDFYNTSDERIYCPFNSNEWYTTDSMNYVRKQKRPPYSTSGLEVSSSGELLLHAPLTMNIDGKIVGTMVIGKNLNDTLDDIHQQHQLELAIISTKQRKETITKTQKDEQKIPAGPYPEEIDHFRVLCSTVSPVPNLAVNVPIKTMKPVNITFNNTIWQVMTAPIRDSQGKDIAKLLIMRNTTEIIAENRHLLLIASVSSFIFLFGLLGFLYAMLKRINKSLQIQMKQTRDSDARHKILFSEAPDAYLILDENDAIIDCNAAACHMFRTEHKKLTGCHLSEIPPEQQPDGFISTDVAKRQIEKVWQFGRNVFSWVVKRFDNEEFWCEVAMSIMYMNEEPIIFASLRDVTDRKKAEEELREYISLLNATLESTADGILVVSTAGKIVQYNNKFVELWGIPDRLIKKGEDAPALEFVTKKLANPTEFIQKVYDLYNFPEKSSLDELHLADGRIFERYSQPQVSSGIITGRVWSFRNITEQKLAESELLESERMAAVGTLAAGVAHNFNNINTGIIGHLEMLSRKEEHLSDKGRKKLEMILNTVKRSSGLTESLMTLTGHRHGTQTKQKLAPLITDTLNLLQTEFNHKGISVNTDISPEAEASCNAGDICHVLYNILVNAVHAMTDSTHKTIHIICTQHEESSCITISDSGCGISQKNIRSIFNPFYTTKGEHAQPGSGMENIRGTGLGLSSSKAIIDNHNGKITVTSEIEKGTTFIITLPVSDSLPEEQYEK